MTKTMKRTLTIILTFVMILSTMTMSFAAGTSDTFETIYLDEVNTVYIYEEYEPVFVEFTPTASGWYLIASDNDGDGENVDPYVCIFDADGEEIAYDDDSIYEDTYNFYCEFEAEAGETYYIALCAYEADVSYDYVITKYIDIDHQPTVDEPYVTLTWDMDCEYQWFEITDDDILAIEGETEATLKNLQVGSAYVCVVTIDGVEYYSDMILYTYAITHQPTIDEPYVELNDNTDAIYQWCSAEEAVVEVTDENAKGFAFADGTASYDAEKGWSGVFIGSAESYEGYAYFEMPLKAGYVLSLELSGDYFGLVLFVDAMSGNFAIEEVAEDGTCEITVPEDGQYVIATYKIADGDDVYVKAQVDGHKFTEIEGATDAQYIPTEDGLYACKVTFADGSTVYSDILEKGQKLQGWVLEGNKWAFYEKGVKLISQWKADSKGWCYLDADGYMATNKWVRDSKGWCYVGADGYCVTDKWVADSKGWCYLGADGRMVTNKWVKDSKGWCYVGADGYCVTDKWVADSKGWCYLGADGRMVTNKWVKDSKGWCYVGADGYCLTNAWKADSKGWCYLDANGRMVINDWVKDGGKWYYLDANGYMVTGTRTIGGKTYKFASNGVWLG